MARNHASPGTLLLAVIGRCTWIARFWTGPRFVSVFDNGFLLLTFLLPGPALESSKEHLSDIALSHICVNHSLLSPSLYVHLITFLFAFGLSSRAG
jgi:hypothetical protein